MVGLIWFVQVVHSPGFGLVGVERFVADEAAHTRRTTWVVGAPMAIEGVTALWLVLEPPTSLGRALPGAAALMLLAVHLSTALAMVMLVFAVARA
jgi:hypothetical protein